MPHDIELTRSPDDRRLYSLEGVGTLRLHGWASRGAIAEADGRSVEISRRGFWRTAIHATGLDGTPVGEFSARGIRRGGTLRWGEREYALRPASNWRERYALVDRDLELAFFDAKGWGKRPVKVTVSDSAEVEPLLLLFTTFVAKGLAEDTGATVAGVTTATTAPTS